MSLIPLLLAALSAPAPQAPRPAPTDPTAPIDPPGLPGAPGLPGLHWTDLEPDGDLDAILVTPAGRLSALRNDGRGAFADATLEVGLAELGAVRSLLPGDIDGDGDQDLVLASARGLVVLERQGEQFARPVSGLEEVGPASGLSWADVNGDDLRDLAIATAAGHRLFVGDGRCGFTELDPGLKTAAGGSGPPPCSAASASAATDDRSTERPPAGAHESAGAHGAEGTNGAGVGPGSPPSWSAGRAPGHLDPVAPCAGTLRDQASGACLQASSVPGLGLLYPLGPELFIDAASGHVGVGTTRPGYALEVAGQVVSGSGNSPSGAGAAIGGGSSNNATGEHATVAGGDANQALADDASIGGGVANLIVGQRATVAGGVGNTASNSAAIGGGETNAAFNFATVSGGRFNDAAGLGACVGGGGNNEASGICATVAGGGDVADEALGNTASGAAAAVGGGRSNGALGAFATVPGGELNVAAGAAALAAGRRARAAHDGAFVWADSTDSDFASTAADQFLVRASGGVGIGTTMPGEQLTVAGVIESTSGGIRFPDGSLQTRALFGGGVPPGGLILTESEAAPDGYSATGWSQALATGTPESWLSRTPLPAGGPTTGSVAVEYQGDLVLLGSDAAGTVHRYDPGSDSWSTLPPLQTPRTELGAAVVGDRLYAVGGIDVQTSQPSDVVEVYDAFLGTWLPADDLPETREGVAVAAAGGRLYAFGGWDPIFPGSGFVAEYDPVADAWTTRAPGFSGTYATAVGLGDRVFLVGGWSNPDNNPQMLDEVFEYVPATDDWIARAALPTPRGKAAAAALGSRIFVLGGALGLGPAPVLDSVEVYDPRLGIWVPFLPLPAPRSLPGTAAVDGRLLAVGGALQGGQLATDLLELEDATVELYYHRKD